MTERNLSYIGGKGTLVISANWPVEATPSSSATKACKRTEEDEEAVAHPVPWDGILNTLTQSSSASTKDRSYEIHTRSKSMATDNRAARSAKSLPK